MIKTAFSDDSEGRSKTFDWFKHVSKTVGNELKMIDVPKDHRHLGTMMLWRKFEKKCDMTVDHWPQG